MHRILIFPVIMPILKPDTGTGYPVQAGNRIPVSGWIFHSTFKCLVKYEINKDIKCIGRFSFPYLQHKIWLHQIRYGYKKTFLEISWNDMNISLLWPDIRLFSVSGFRPDIRCNPSFEWLQFRPSVYPKMLSKPCFPFLTKSNKLTLWIWLYPKKIIKI
jgi:hypothetical protein